jgi:probable RNA-binding protein EIF1AD
MVFYFNKFQNFSGDFVIVDPIEEGTKVRAEIAHILYPQQVKYLKKEGLW